MLEQNNTPESPYPGPAEPGSEEDVYPDTQDDPGRRQGDVGIETPDDEPVHDAEEPTPGNRI